MLKKLIRPGLFVSLVALAILLAGSSLRSSVTARPPGGEIHIESFSWGMSSANYLRVCMGSEVPATSRIDLEEVSLCYVEIKFESGDVALERSLTVPSDQFRCTDISHSELVAAGLVQEPNTRIHFMVEVGLRETQNVGAAQRITVGSAETITIGGQTQIHKTIQTRQISVVQDL